MCARCDPETHDLFRAAWSLARERDAIDAATVPLASALNDVFAAIVQRVIATDSH
jgi:hypothetical protein